ncbi:MAG: alpha-amylase family glycosyl hydrolase, partial [Eubacteriales bacterium]
LFIENHDLCRSVSRFADDNELRYESATMFAVMIYCMRGIPFIYQGQEIGVTNSHFDSIKDFDDWETIDFYNANKDKMTHDNLMERVNFGSRDNARHPMPWNSTKNGGFNKGGKTWLPLYPSYKEINVEKDISSEKSILRFYKELLQIRRSSEILRYGTFEDITGEAKEYFMYRRAYNGKSILVVCNYEKRSSIPLPENIRRVLGNYPLHADNVFSPYEAAIYAEE